MRFWLSTRFYGALEVVEEVGSGVLNFHSFRRRSHSVRHSEVSTGDIIGAAPPVALQRRRRYEEKKRRGSLIRGAELYVHIISGGLYHSSHPSTPTRIDSRCLVSLQNWVAGRIRQGVKRDIHHIIYNNTYITVASKYAVILFFSPFIKPLYNTTLVYTVYIRREVSTYISVI